MNLRNSLGQEICLNCPCRTPYRCDPSNLTAARNLQFEPPLDAGIKDVVHTLIAAGIETFESCEGGAGHAFPEPTVRFEGDNSEGLRAFAAAMAASLPVFYLRRVWVERGGSIHGPWWEMTFFRPRPALLDDKS